MTPEQTAKEIVDKYRFFLLPFITFQTQLSEQDLMFKCKQCAEFHCQGILDELDYVEEVRGDYMEVEALNTLIERRKFYCDVLNEINKL